MSRWIPVAFACVAFLGLAACSRRPAPSPWQAVPVATDAEFTGIWFADSLHGFVAGGGFAIPGGILGETHDGGRSWTFESGIVDAAAGFALHRMHFVDAEHGCIVADGGMVLRTDDGGAHWRRATREPLSGASHFDLQFLDARRAWAIGPSSIVRSEDGGETWVTVARNTAENGYLSGNALHFLDAQRGFLAGANGTLRRSDDGGFTWDPVVWPQRDGEHPTFWDITFADPSHGWVVGDEGTILHTTDGGATWARQEQGLDRLNLFAVQFLDPAHGLAIGSYPDVAESVILRTRDGGAHWQVEHVQPGETLRALFLLDEHHAWAAGDRARTQSQVILRYDATAR